MEPVPWGKGHPMGIWGNTGAPVPNCGRRGSAAGARSIRFLYSWNSALALFSAPPFFSFEEPFGVAAIVILLVKPINN